MSALGQKLPFVNYSMPQGLSSPNVTSFAQDENGFTWIGTENGLNRFDGTECRIYTIEDGLPSRHISKLHRAGALIYGVTIDGQLFTIKNSKIEKLLPHTDELSEVFDLTYRNDTLWIAAINGLYSYSDDQLKKIHSFDGNDKVVIAKLDFDAKGTLHICTHHHGIFKRQSSEQFKKLPIPNTSGRLDFVITPENKLFVGGHHFLHSLGKDSTKELRPPNNLDRNWARCLISDNANGLWIGSDETGLYHYDINSDEFHHFGMDEGLSAKSISALYLDENGILWIGTMGHGFSCLYNKNLSLFDGFEDNNIISVQTDLKGKDVVVSSFTSGLYKSNGKSPVGNYATRSFNNHTDYELIKIQPHNSVMSLHHEFKNITNTIPKQGYTVWDMEEGENETWFGMNYALFARSSSSLNNYKKDEYGLASDVVYSIDYDDDSLWVGLELGAACVVDGQVVWNYKSPEKIKNSSKIVFHDSKGRLWSGGNKLGLELKKGNLLVPALENSDWQSTQITDIVEDPYQRVWSSSNGNGIAVIDKSQVHYLTIDNGLPSGFVMSLAFDGDLLVAGTDQGLFQTNISTKSPQDYQFQKIDASAVFSIPCNRNAAQVDSTGVFWIGTPIGLFAYKPNEKLKTYPAPTPYLQDAKLLFASTPLDSFLTDDAEIEIPYANNSLRFKVGAIYYEKSNQLSYSFLLKGSDNTWSDANASTDITFNDLAPGNYELILKARDAQNDWGQDQLLLAFEITTPFWLNWIFQLSMGLVFVLLLVAVFKWRTSRLQAINLRLEQYATEKTREIKIQNEQLEQGNRDKEALLQEIHHRVKNNLQIIISLLSLQLRRVEDDSGKQVLEQSIGRIKTMSLIHQNLYQTENFSETGFKAYLEELMGHMMSNFRDISEIEYEIKGQNFRLGTEKAIPMALIAHEWVNNIYKHAFPDKKGRIEIKLKEEEGICTMQISDDGVGISKADFMASKNSLGAKIIKSLSRQIDADLDIYSPNEGGTQIELKLKK